jgi:phosphatidylinositol glycan class M
MRPAVAAALALAVRLLLVFCGERRDQAPGLRYTDIDYLVFSDAADHVIHNLSPYARPTFRYSPLVAYVLLPNALFGRRFGKILFCLFDVATGAIIRALVPARHALFALLLWDFNPIVINISTRGNADSATAFLLVLVVLLLERRRHCWAAVLFGLAVHLRLFPAFLSVTLLAYLGYRIIPFGVIAYATFASLNLYFFWRYGGVFLGEVFLYHLARRDYRHNFAPPWLGAYLNDEGSAAWAVVRVALTLAISLYFWGDLRRSWAAVIVCFVAYNPVCTVQYFDWALALLALVPESVRTRRFLSAAVAWLLAHAAWLGIAYRLEFRAENLFYQLWAASVAVFVANNAVLWALLSGGRGRGVKEE